MYFTNSLRVNMYSSICNSEKLMYSVSIWTLWGQHLLKPQACFKAVMEEALTASLHMILGREKMDDRWVNFIFDPKGKQSTM